MEGGREHHSDAIFLYGLSVIFKRLSIPELQSANADIGATLDLIITPDSILP